MVETYGWYSGQYRKLYSKPCEVCASVFHVPRHVLPRRSHCSLKCFHASRGVSVKLVCETCKVPFSRSASKIKNSRSGLSFCSVACKNMAQRIDGRPEIRPSHYKSGEYKYRERAFRSHGQICSRCGYKEDPTCWTPTLSMEIARMGYLPILRSCACGVTLLKPEALGLTLGMVIGR
jgi:hypothetical protein